MTRPARLPLWQVVAYAAPALPFTMLVAPSLSIIPALYLSHGEVGSHGLAFGLLLTRASNALMLPFAGIVSDRFFSRAAQRCTLLGVATLCAGLAWWQWLAIEAHGGLAGFIGWSLVLLAAIALFETNHLALASDMARGDDARIRLLSARLIASLAGFVTCFAVLEWRRDPGALGVAALDWLTWVTILLLMLSAVPFQIVVRRAGGEALAAVRFGGGQLVRSIKVLRDPAVRALISVTALQSLASGMTAALIFVFLDRLLGLAWAVSQVFLVGSIVGMAVSLSCPAVVRGSSCRALLVGSATVSALVSVGLGLLPLFDGGRAAVVLLFVIAAMAAPPGMIAASTLMARFVLPPTDPSGENRLATAYGASAALNLAASGIGAALAVHLLPERGAPSQMLILLAVISWIPALCHVLAALIAFKRLPSERSQLLEAI